MINHYDEDMAKMLRVQDNMGNKFTFVGQTGIISFQARVTKSFKVRSVFVIKCNYVLYLIKCAIP